MAFSRVYTKFDMYCSTKQILLDLALCNMQSANTIYFSEELDYPRTRDVSPFQRVSERSKFSSCVKR